MLDVWETKAPRLSLKQGCLWKRTLSMRITFTVNVMWLAHLSILSIYPFTPMYRFFFFYSSTFSHSPIFPYFSVYLTSKIFCFYASEGLILLILFLFKASKQPKILKTTGACPCCPTHSTGPEIINGWKFCCPQPISVAFVIRTGSAHINN